MGSVAAKLPEGPALRPALMGRCQSEFADRQWPRSTSLSTWGYTIMVNTALARPKHTASDQPDGMGVRRSCKCSPPYSDAMGHSPLARARFRRGVRSMKVQYVRVRLVLSGSNFHVVVCTG